eukprot:3453610-Pyramimonas_sp.AAC.1
MAFLTFLRVLGLWALPCPPPPAGKAFGPGRAGGVGAGTSPPARPNGSQLDAPWAEKVPPITRIIRCAPRKPTAMAPQQRPLVRRLARLRSWPHRGPLERPRVGLSRTLRTKMAT